MGVQKLADWGRLLMAMEIRAARKYWHIPSSSTTYPEPFKSNKVGAACTSWCGHTARAQDHFAFGRLLLANVPPPLLVPS